MKFVGYTWPCSKSSLTLPVLLKTSSRSSPLLLVRSCPSTQSTPTDACKAHYQKYFKKVEGDLDEPDQVIFDWNELKKAGRSFLDCIIIELAFPRAPYPNGVLYQILKDACDEAPREAKRFPQSLWDSIGDFSVRPLPKYLNQPTDSMFRMQSQFSKSLRFLLLALKGRLSRACPSRCPPSILSGSTLTYTLPTPQISGPITRI